MQLDTCLLFKLSRRRLSVEQRKFVRLPFTALLYKKPSLDIYYFYVYSEHQDLCHVSGPFRQSEKRSVAREPESVSIQAAGVC